MSRLLAIVLAAAALSACATVPDVTATYYLPKATTKVTVVQSVVCNSEGKRVFYHSDASQVTSFSADRDRGHPVSYKVLDGAFSDSNTALAFYDDGRLKGVNASTGGKADEIAKAAITVASIALPIFGLTEEPAAEQTPCDVIKAWGGGDPVTLSYGTTIDYARDFASSDTITKPLKPDPGNDQFVAAVGSSLPQPILVATLKDVLVNPARYEPPEDAEGKPDKKDVLILKLNATREVKLSVSNGTDKPFWEGTAFVPAAAEHDYDVPIPKSALFGKQGFTLALTEAGAITSLGYSKEAGIGGVLNTAAAGLTEAKPKTDAERAAELKGQADLIAQQKRLVACEAGLECSP
ncbi:MAG: hypothetical protein GC203_16410 [Phenylobacterium sp.]|uniref:hypothetical protein n=1 Tax=Phenylobacterium sp. TaxID=1871053 RepID=UPI0025E73AFD|nr:hypothetical protein [Phenylobacterium sp.]MBI1199445.1 hypothetical protein [Phenylobacterium sp.]